MSGGTSLRVGASEVARKTQAVTLTDPDTGLKEVLSASIVGGAEEATQLLVKTAVEASEVTLDSLNGKLDTLLTATANMAVDVDRTADATESLRDDTGDAPVYAAGREYEPCPASATTTLGATGAVGDDLDHIVIVPGTTSPSSVSIKDGSDTAIVVFTGGASSVSNLVPFTVPLNLKSRTGAWQIVTGGANVTVLAAGNFT